MKKRSKKQKILHKTSSNKNVSASPYLAGHIVERIFTFLPIKDAVRMAVLSKGFRDSWRICRNIIFDRELVWSWGRYRIKAVVSRVFALYDGKEIACFKLCFDPYNETSLVETWIGKSVEKGVEELEMDFSPSTRIVELRNGVFDIPSLKILHLRFCRLELPPELTGLRFLNTLILRRVHLLSSLIETIFQTCLRLETVDLVGCYYISEMKINAAHLKLFKVLKIGNCLCLNHISINAPTLLSFHYFGNLLPVFRIENGESLSDVLLNFKPLRTYNLHGQVLRLVPRLSHVRVFTASSNFVEGLARKLLGDVLRFELCFWHMKELHLLMEDSDFCNIYDIIQFVRHCPMLEKFFMDLGDYTFENTDYWKLHQKGDFERFGDMFNSLKVLKIEGFKYQKLEMELVKIFLRRGNVLEKVVLVTQRCNRKLGHIREVVNHVKDLESCRASPNARIEAYERFDDKSSTNPTHPSRIWDS